MYRPMLLITFLKKMDFNYVQSWVLCWG